MAEDADNKESADLDFHTDIPVGEILRRTRTHYGQNLQQIEQILRIRASNLDAIERGDIAQLPGRVYAIGFVRAYSEYLGLDGDKMVHLFKEQSVGVKKKVDLSFPVPAAETKVANWYIIGSSLFGLLVILGFITLVVFPGKGRNEIPAVPDALTEATLSDAPALVEAPETQVQTTTQAPTPEPANPENRIVLEIKEASWIEIRNAQDAAILRKVLKPGDIYMVPPEDGLVMSTGNAGGIVIKLDGKELPPLGESGEIKRKISLNPKDLGPKS